MKASSTVVKLKTPVRPENSEKSRARKSEHAEINLSSYDLRSKPCEDLSYDSTRSS